MDQDNNYISRDRSCKEFSIEFSYVYPIQGSSFKSILRLLSCNNKHFLSLPTSTKDLSTDSQTLHNHCLKLLVATVSGCELLPNKMLNREK